MALLHGPAMVIILTLFGAFELAAAQIYTSCNPVVNTTCPPDPALGTTFAWDFRKGASDSFTTDSWWLPYLRYDSINGATMTVNRSGVAPTLTSKFYIMFGRLDVVIKTAAGIGMVTDVIFESDDQDEIDLEWVATSPNTVQSNYYSPRGRWPVYNQMQVLATSSSMQTQFRTYTVDWNADRLSWYIDGTLMRTVNSTGNDQYPQTPMKITIGLWAGGDPGNSPYTVYWAGGYTNYSNGPFETSVQSIKVTDYSSGSAYSYGDRTGLWGSIQAINGSVRPHATAAASSNVVSTFSVVAGLLPTAATATQSSIATNIPTLPTTFPLSISPNGHCGVTANSSTCAGSMFGNCCSAYGFCGSGPEYCGDGCLQYFGLCGNQIYTPSPSSTLTASPLPLPTDLPILGISRGGYCGLSNGSSTCLGSGFGNCCSQYGSCGGGSDWCGVGCQPSFGNCIGYPNKVLPSSPPSMTSTTLALLSTTYPVNTYVSGVSIGGYCGTSNGSTTCTGSVFGSCCSQWDSCGNTDEYCGAGCQPAFGSCSVFSPGLLSSSVLGTQPSGLSTFSFAAFSSPSLIAGPSGEFIPSSSSTTSVFALVSSSVSCPSPSPVSSSLSSSWSSTVSVTLSSTSTLTIKSQSSTTSVLSLTSTTSSTLTPNSDLMLSSNLNPTSNRASSMSTTSTLISNLMSHSNSSFSSASTTASSPVSTPIPTSILSLPTLVIPVTSIPQYSSNNTSASTTTSTSIAVTSSTSSSVNAVAQQEANSTVSGSSLQASNLSTSVYSSTVSTSTNTGTKTSATSLAVYGSMPNQKSSSINISTTGSPNSAPTTLTTFVCPAQNGASYLSPYSSPNKVYKLLCNSDLSAANTVGIGWGGGPSLLRCIEYCEAKPGCVAVTYAPWFGTGACYYKGSIGTVTTVTNASLAILAGTQPASTASKTGMARRWMAW